MGGRTSPDHACASRTFTELYERYIDTDEVHPPNPRIAEYVAALLRRWPDMDDDPEDTSPWSTGPLLNEASGPLIYFPLRWNMAEEASAFATELASSIGLNCYDPQKDELRT